MTTPPNPEPGPLSQSVNVPLVAIIVTAITAIIVALIDRDGVRLQVSEEGRITATAEARATTIAETRVATSAQAPSSTSVVVSTPRPVPTMAPPFASPPPSTISVVVPKPVPVVVGWKPDYPGGPGICIDGCADFVPWEIVKAEIEVKVLPQLKEVSAGSHLGLQDFQGKKNWVVTVTGPNGAIVGNVFFGTNPQKNYDYDGLIWIAIKKGSSYVYSAFQRFSDGSYRRG